MPPDFRFRIMKADESCFLYHHSVLVRCIHNPSYPLYPWSAIEAGGMAFCPNARCSLDALLVAHLQETRLSEPIELHGSQLPVVTNHSCRPCKCELLNFPQRPSRHPKSKAKPACAEAGSSNCAGREVASCWFIHGDAARLLQHEWSVPDLMYDVLFPWAGREIASFRSLHRYKAEMRGQG